MSFLEVTQVTKSFKGMRVLNACTFNVDRHNIIGLIGPNGSGKTTLLNIVTGYEQVDTGDISFDGVSLTNLTTDKVVNLGISRTFQHARIFPHLTIWDHMQLAAPTRTLGDLFSRECSAVEQRRAQKLLEFVGIASLKHQMAGTLSYGQKKLLELACTLMTEPQMMLLDEPTGGIHPKLISSLATYIRELHTRGLTILIVEHNVEFILQLCTHVIVLNGGSIIAYGTPEQVYASQTVREAYFGKAKI